MFIALEGGEGVGKTTIASILKKKLEQDKLDVIITREPGGIPAAEAIRANIFDYKVEAKTELLLYLAARREHLINKIMPSLNNGNIVITDRFYLSTLAYQGYARGLGIDLVRELNSFVCDVYPDINILLDAPVKLGLSRRISTTELNRIDLESFEFHNKVYEGYKILAEQGKDNIEIVDSTRSIEDVASHVYQIIKNL
ncbi:MAG: hypothetical protein ATN34_02825 [Epulopiscium sp. Nele67-Bin002]|nr:MAG: hypothetical protein ATN34_02825 [Epulopiscium sp. Nele67-Bin002]